MQQLRESAASASAAQFEAIVEDALTQMHKEKTRQSIAGGKVKGGLVQIQEFENLAIIGDLHGDSVSLLRILSDIDFERFLANPKNKLIFMGDYVDRGSDSVGVLYMVCHLKNSFPQSVLLMRGNHEAPSEFPFSSHDLPYRIVERFGEPIGKRVYGKVLSMFRELSVATIIGRKLLIVHGGLPTGEEAVSNYQESLATAHENHTRSRVLEEILWNDPRPVVSSAGWEPSRRGIGRHFGAGITQRWLEASGTCAVVRGHEPCQGFRIDHGGKIMTLFSCLEAYPGFRGAYLVSSKDNLEARNDAKDLVSDVRFLG
ncbi:MAG: serine/threonine protein phosphatase [Nitrososphaera sp.]|nr:serine/threonine protein phosphatase [Nitrososphaera sp.]